MWIKNFRKRKGQTALLFAIIFLCSMLLRASLHIMTNIETPYETLATECHAPALLVYTHSNEPSQVKEIGRKFKSLEDVDDVKEYTYHYVTEKVTFHNKKIDAFMDLSTYDENFVGHVRVLEGKKRSNETAKGKRDCLACLYC